MSIRYALYHPGLGMKLFGYKAEALEFAIKFKNKNDARWPLTVPVVVMEEVLPDEFFTILHI